MHELVERSANRRADLSGSAETTAYRLVNGAADGLPGVTVDRYAGALVVNLYEPQTPHQEQALVAALAALPGVRAVYLKHRPRSAARLSKTALAALAPSTPAWGEALDEVVVRENGLRFLIRPGAGLSTGLFLDMRAMRARVHAEAAGRSVLNLFAYTCAFGVAAMAGGAARALNLDAARPALRWGAENYALNGLDADPYDFVYGDAFDWLGRFARRAQRFDIVIADPPSFSSVKGRRFAVSHDYARLAASCARVTAPGGLLILCANEASLPRHAFRDDCLRGIGEAGRQMRILSLDSASTLDFPPPTGAESHLKCLVMSG